MDLSFAPRNRLAEAFMAGWRLIPGHDYTRKDWAVLLMKTDEPAPTEGGLRKLMAVFTLASRSNKSRGSSSRNVALQAKRFAARAT